MSIVLANLIYLVSSYFSLRTWGRTCYDASTSKMSKFIVTTYYSKDNTFYGSISDIIMEIFEYPIFESFDPYALVFSH